MESNGHTAARLALLEVMAGLVVCQGAPSPETDPGEGAEGAPFSDRFR
jgi:hypothetical protein